MVDDCFMIIRILELIVYTYSSFIWTFNWHIWNYV